MRRTLLILLCTIFILSMRAGLSAAQTADQTNTNTDITAVNIISVTSNQASISFSYTSAIAAGALRYQAQFGTTTTYGSSAPSIHGVLADQNGSANVQLGGLSAGTTYHFIIQLFDSGTNKLVRYSSDRTFTTPTATGDSSILLIERIRADCIDRSCQVYFSTNKRASVEIYWDTTNHDNYTDYGSVTGETPTITDGGGRDGFRSIRMPESSQPPLSANSKYHYRLRATGLGGATFTTGDLTLDTGSNAADHTFSTGACTDTSVTPNVSVDIGSCLGTRYCDTGGTLSEDCTKCGYVCPSSPPRTCRSGAMSATCDPDPDAKAGIATQCNKTDCYKSNGLFKSPAVAGCYASWPECNANTILKVRKDRGCNLWLTCGTSIQTEATANGKSDNLCLSLSACNSLNTKGQCNHYLPLGQCDNDALRFCNDDTDCQNGGTCNNPDPKSPTKALQNLTYLTPKDISKIANLSGNVVAGLDWGSQGGANVIQGLLPWQLMRQVGGNALIQNGDLEFRVPSSSPWVTVPAETPTEAIKVDFENRDDGPNHVLYVDPITQTEPTKRCQDTSAVSATAPANPTILNKCVLDTDCRPTGYTSAACVNSGLCIDDTVKTNPKINTPCTLDTQCRPGSNTTAVCNDATVVPYSGAATNAFNAAPTEYYYAEARIRSENGNPVIRMQFGHSGYSKFTVQNTFSVCSNDSNRSCTSDNDCSAPGLCNVLSNVTTNTYVDVAVSAAWQRVTIGPLKGMSGETRLAFVCADKSSCDKFMVDDVQVRPILQVSNNPTYVTPSCRLYPKDDSPSCDYADANGVIYKGWKGYCLEHDSQTGTCLSWWPVDIIKGESSIFGTEKVTGYQDRSPLFMCAEAAGLSTSDGYYHTMQSEVNVRTPYPDENECLWTYLTCTPGKICSSTNLDTSVVTQTVSAADQQILERNVDHIALQGEYCGRGSNHMAFGGPAEFGGATPILTKNTTNNGSCDNFFNGQPWTYCDNGDPQNYNAIHFQFNATDGHLESISVRTVDVGSAEGGIQVVPKFFMKEQCTKIVEVVQDTGVTAAFASRVGSSIYKVPDLSYGLTTDFKPYGGIISPESAEANDPTSWGTLYAEQMNLANFSSPGQARADNPYACAGLCTDVICSGDGKSCLDSTTGKINPARVTACQQLDTNLDGLPDAGCYGVSATAASAKGKQQFASGACVGGVCTGASSCNSTPTSCNKSLGVTGHGVLPSLAITDAKNQCGINSSGQGSKVACDGSHGSCQGTQSFYTVYTETGHHCSFSIYMGMKCYSSGTCTPGGTQKNYFERTPPVGLAASCTNSNQCQSSFIGATDFFAQEHIKRLFTETYGVWTSMRCSGNNDLGCVTDGDCPAGAGTCTVSKPGYAHVANSSSDTPVSNFIGWKPPDSICPINPAFETNSCTSSPASCTASLQVTGATAANYWATAGASDAGAKATAMADAQSKCGLTATGGQTKIACDGTANGCDGTEEGFKPGQYAPGTKAFFTTFKTDAPCSMKLDAASKQYYTCVGRCSSIQSYVNASKPTVKPQAKYLRPDYAPNSEADYCAIPPEVKNIKFVTGTATTATITGSSGSIGIKFNTQADVEQVPLSTIRIDWGDGQDEYAYPYAPRNDPTKPHIFSHTYVVNRGDATHCTTYNGRTSCDFPIKIQVEDGWHWCNDAVTGGTSGTIKCHQEHLGSGLIDSTDWVSTGLNVVVQP